MYEILTPEERASAAMKETGIDIIDPSKETRRRKYGRKLRGASREATRRAKARARKVPSYARKGARTAGRYTAKAGRSLVKQVRGTPESRKALREKLKRKLQEQPRQQQQQGFGSGNMGVGTGISVAQQPRGMDYFLGSPARPSKRDRRRASKRRRKQTGWGRLY